MDINQLKKLIPKDKFDFEPLPTLMEISEDDVKPILRDLLFCLADINWPIASKMIPVLLRFPDSIVPVIRDVLNPTEEDVIWKYFIIANFIRKLPRESQNLLLEDIKRIQNNPTRSELSEFVWEMANDYMNEYEAEISNEEK